MPQSARTALTYIYEKELGKKLKVLEETLEVTLESEKPYIIRLDGVAFRTFTKGIVKPFDGRLTDALVETTRDLVAKFSPIIGYAHSDEISLVFLGAEQLRDMADPAEPPSKKRKSDKPLHFEHIYGGRVQKLASVTASYAAARLNYHLSTYDFSDRKSEVQERMKSHIAYFDSRLVPIPDMHTAMECIFWRSNCEGFRNAISTIANVHFTSNQLHGKNLDRQLDLLAEAGINPFESYDLRFLFGTWVKKEQYVLQDVKNPKTGEDVGPVIRSRVRHGSFNWADWTDEERTSFVKSKFWTNEVRDPPKTPLPANAMATANA
ncbi:tRNAHis guanylyltransferase-domain-containing protein [Gaertneriomyces semiglobifer]|nr:tRNAHis guanylyltransferase-domain-containing protein [Gaertneriomyces semiglobifer]